MAAQDVRGAGDRIQALFDLDEVGDDTFRVVPRRPVRALPQAPAGGPTPASPSGWPMGPPRLFGGQIASQALAAAARTVEVDHAVNSLHAYFLQAGRYDAPVDYVVDRIREGRSFTTRRVVAVQDGSAILGLDASFHCDEPGEELAPQSPSPVARAGPPEEGAEPEEAPWMRGRPIEMRIARHAPPGVRSVWVRVPARLPDDPVLHAAMLTFLSDMGPVSVVSGSLTEPSQSRMMASLDHCMWFHHPARADEWLLYELEAVTAARARGVARGSLWTADGRLVVTLTQEALARPRR